VVTITGGGKAPGECAFDRDRRRHDRRRHAAVRLRLSLAQTLVAMNHATLAVERADGERVVFVVGIDGPERAGYRPPRVGTPQRGLVACRR
jgi:hypothetical protein